MGALSSQQIRDLIDRPTPIVSNYKNLEDQIQPNGLDLTLNSVATLADSGNLGITNEDRHISHTAPLDIQPNESIKLCQGCYLVTLNEILHIPNNLMAIGKPRSSLLRCGVSIQNAIWDAGFNGISQVLMIIHNPLGFSLVQDTRILQLVFFTLESPTLAPYKGQYQMEND
jgi:dUTP pyrophosphatase